MFHRTQSINEPILIYKLINPNMLVDFSPIQSSKLSVRNGSTPRRRITKFCAKINYGCLKGHRATFGKTLIYRRF